MDDSPATATSVPASRGVQPGVGRMENSVGKLGWRHTCSQRFGYEPLPKPMQLEYLSPDLRREIWNEARADLDSKTFFDSYNEERHFQEDGLRIVKRVMGTALKKTEDEVGTDFDVVLDFFKQRILRARFNRVLDLVEVLVSELPGDDFAVRIARSFDGHAAAYWLNLDQRPYRFFPRSNASQGEAVRNAIKAIRGSGMSGAEAHLRRAAEHMNSRGYAESVKDSILAVESVARVIDPKAEKTLGPALKSLEKRRVIRHVALKEAFSRLYGYTSDEQGIRHALLDKSSPGVGIDEAMFMFGACASFAAYLANKHKKSADTSEGNGGE